MAATAELRRQAERTAKPMARALAAPVLCTLWALLVTSPLAAETTGDAKFDRVAAAAQIEPRLDAQVPLDLELVDMTGTEITLGSILNGNRPALLTLVYYTCPSLCNQVMEALVTTLVTTELVPGKDFDVVIVSMDPRDGAAQSRTRHAHFLERYGRPETSAGWHHLTGTEANVRLLADTIGFGYRWVEEQKQYAHGAGLFMITPAGRLSRVLGGVAYEPDPIEMALVDAGEGKIGSPFARFILMTCMSWDPVKGRYIPAAFTIMKIGGVITILLVGGLLLILHATRHKQKAQTAPQIPAGTTP